MRVHVYRNLRHHNQLAWSIVANEGPTRGRVLEVVSAALLKDATFVVRESGRQRVLREQVKNVHAFVRGTLVRSVPLGCKPREAAVRSILPPDSHVMQVTYDPYLRGNFFDAETGEAVVSAPMVAATSSGVFAAVGNN